MADEQEVLSTVLASIDGLIDDLDSPAAERERRDPDDRDAQVLRAAQARFRGMQDQLRSQGLGALDSILDRLTSLQVGDGDDPALVPLIQGSKLVPLLQGVRRRYVAGAFD